MKVRKSAAPFYAVAVIWLAYALLFPLYRVSHFLIVGVISAVAFLLLTALCAKTGVPEVEKTEKAQEKPKEESTGNTDLDKMLKDGRLAIAEMKRLDESIEDAAVSADIVRLQQVSEKIFARVKEEPAKLPQIRRFMDYYLPTTLKLLNAYDRASSAGISGENVDATKAKALTEKIEAYRALSKATEALSTSPSDIRSTTLVTGTVKYGGETMTTTINSEARSKTTIRNGKVLHASETKMTQDGVTSEQGTWIKDGWLYIYANAGGVTIKNKVAIDDAATAVDPEEVVTTQSGGVGLAFVKSITAAKSGSNTVYSVTVDQKAAAAISSIVSDLVDTEDEDLTSVEVSDMVLTYTLNSQGQLNNMKTSFTMKILYASGKFKGDPMTMDLNCSVDSSVLATGSAVTITFPDFSDYVLLETN